MTGLPNPLQSAAHARPHHPALVIGGKTLSASELCYQVARRARDLRELGIHSGHRVLLRGEPSEAWVVAFHALGWLGAEVVLLPPERSGEKPEVQAVIDAGMLPDLGAEPLPERFWPLSEPRLVLYSSGSTGDPRPISLSTAQLFFGAMGSALRLGHDPTDRWLCCLPLCHVGGAAILLRCAWYGTTAVVESHFDAARVALALDSGEVTQISLVPTMLQRVLAARADVPFPRTLRTILVGGGPTSEALRTHCRRLGAPVAYSWGMTETGSQVATSFVGSQRLCALPFARVQAQGSELVVLGPQVEGGGPLRTRDHGTTSEGSIQILGRTDRTIISGGKKIDPARLEAALQSHPAIADVYVMGEEDREWGEHPVALLVLATNTERPGAPMLQAWCRKTLPAFMLAHRFVWVGALPRNPLGKLPLSALRDLESSALQSGEELLGNGDGPKVLAVDQGMDVTRPGADVARGTQDLKSKGEGGLADPLELQSDLQPIADAHGAPEVSFHVNQGHAPGVEGSLPGAEGGQDELLEGSVAVLEEATEENNAGPVNLEKSRGDSVLKRHDHDPSTKRRRKYDVCTQ